MPNQLKYIFNKNTVVVKQKIKKELIKKPSLSDKLGFVYGYFSPYDTNRKDNFWIKLGRTELINPKLRIDQQNGEMIFIEKTGLNQKFEKIIHLFFNYCHATRIINNKKETEWFHFNEKINIGSHISIIKNLIEDIHNINYSQYTNKINSIGTNIINFEQLENITKIDINKATKDELMRLKRIGPIRSEIIINYRKIHGSFNIIEDIMKIKSIGQNIFLGIKPFIVTCTVSK